MQMGQAHDATAAGQGACGDTRNPERKGSDFDVPVEPFSERRLTERPPGSSEVKAAVATGRRGHASKTTRRTIQSLTHARPNDLPLSRERRSRSFEGV